MSAKSSRGRQPSSRRRARPNPNSRTVRGRFSKSMGWVHDRLKAAKERGRTRRVNALYTSRQAMPPMHAQAGIGNTKKSRNCARGAAKAKKDAKAYIAPARCDVREERTSDSKAAYRSRRANDSCVLCSTLAIQGSQTRRLV